MARASQVVLSENEYYLIKAPNGKVLEVKDFSTANGAFIQLWDYAGHPWQQWRFVDAWTQARAAGASRTALPAR